MCSTEQQLSLEILDETIIDEGTRTTLEFCESLMGNK